MIPAHDSQPEKSSSLHPDIINLAYKSSRECQIIIDPDETIIHANAATEKLFYCKEQEITGEKFSNIFLDTIPADQVESIIKEGVARGWEGECLMERRGEFFPTSLSFSPITDENGKCLGALINIRDITRGKKTLSKRMHAEKMKALGEMISSVAHDLNNPLAGVVGYAELLEEQVKAGPSVPPEQLIEEAQIINQEARRASRIVQNLMAFIRSEEPSREPIELNSLLKETITTHKRGVQDQSVQIFTDLAANLPMVSGDPYMLQQVFLNILINAHQAIKGHRKSGEITVKTTQEKELIVIRIIDDGPGISPGIIKSIFEPFFTTKKPGMGSGLGLAIANSIIHSHEGTIEAENNRTNGATFIIRLPRLNQRQRSTLEPIDIKIDIREQLKNMRVLVVDDEAGICTLAQRLLHHLGVGKVDVAEEGAEALRKMERFKYDLVITDVKMPVMSGMELYQNAQEDESLQKIPFVFITGNLLCSTTEEFLRRYKLPYINKPFAVASLVRVIEKALTR